MVLRGGEEATFYPSCLLIIHSFTGPLWPLWQCSDFQSCSESLILQRRVYLDTCMWSRIIPVPFITTNSPVRNRFVLHVWSRCTQSLGNSACVMTTSSPVLQLGEGKSLHRRLGRLQEKMSSRNLSVECREYKMEMDRLGLASYSR